MIIDVILDRRAGVKFDPEEMLEYIRAEEEIFGIEPSIADPMEVGDEIETKASLCEYIIHNGYNPDICGYIWSEKWTDDSRRGQFIRDYNREAEEYERERIEELEERQHQSGFYAFQDMMEMRRFER